MFHRSKSVFLLIKAQYKNFFYSIPDDRPHWNLPRPRKWMMNNKLRHLSSMWIIIILRVPVGKGAVAEHSMPTIIMEWLTANFGGRREAVEECSMVATINDENECAIENNFVTHIPHFLPFGEIIKTEYYYKLIMVISPNLKWLKIKSPTIFLNKFCNVFFFWFIFILFIYLSQTKMNAQINLNIYGAKLSFWWWSVGFNPLFYVNKNNSI